MSNFLKKKRIGIQKLYENRQKFILIGLTGRTGSGCTSAGKILNKEFTQIKLPKPHSFKNNEDRKYRIIYNYAKVNWKKFHLIQIRDIITTFIIENTFDQFLDYLNNEVYNEENLFHDIKDELISKIKIEYDKIYQLRRKLTEERRGLKKGKRPIAKM